MADWSSYWLMSLLFIFHDFEELVLVPHWLEKHNSNIHGRILFGGVNRSDVLAIGIWEELGKKDKSEGTAIFQTTQQFAGAVRTAVVSPISTSGSNIKDGMHNTVFLF